MRADKRKKRAAARVIRAGRQHVQIDVDRTGLERNADDNRCNRVSPDRQSLKTNHRRGMRFSVAQTFAAKEFVECHWKFVQSLALYRRSNIDIVAEYFDTVPRKRFH
ncbi:hypothetical protein [Burkholderia stabilis]|uniref:hypothetical protein n=1 Tax=Burkholderia stabilis TaxID=95485 RepID=UPI001591409B|nr:hypothetical protein [Burkholderia stabilis]